MGVASLVIGIISIVLSFIPCVNWFALVPSIVGIILGAVGLSKAKKANEPTGCATAGLVLNIISCVWIVVWGALLGAAAGAVATELNSMAL